MNAIVVPRNSDNTMSGYNTHVELDEVHTPSRYFALLSYLSTWEAHCAFLRFFCVFMLSVKSCMFSFVLAFGVFTISTTTTTTLP